MTVPFKLIARCRWSAHRLTPVSIKQGAGRTGESVWSFWGREKSFSYQDSNLNYPGSVVNVIPVPVLKLSELFFAAGHQQHQTVHWQCQQTGNADMSVALHTSLSLCNIYTPCNRKRYNDYVTTTERTLRNCTSTNREETLCGTGLIRSACYARLVWCDAESDYNCEEFVFKRH